MQIKITWGWLALLTFTFALLLVAASKVDLTTDTIIQHPTNWVDPLKLTNALVFESPKPRRVTIWFQYQWNNGFEFYPAALGSISTNVWWMTVSNAEQMVIAHLKSQGSEWKFITLTGIWRDE